MRRRSITCRGTSDRARCASATRRRDQLQLDGYGELVEAVAEMCRRGRSLARETQTMMRQLGDFVCDHWRDPDQGIWEPREPPSAHTYSRVMCWVALDRLLQLHRAGFIQRLPAERIRTRA